MLEKERYSSREVWFDGRLLPIERQDIWSLINNSVIQKIILTETQWREGHYPLKTQLMVEVTTPETIRELENGVTVLSSDQSLLKYAEEKGLKTCIFFDIVGRSALEAAWQEAANYDYLLVDFDLPTNIPLELIIARLQKGKTNILKPVTNLADMEVCFGVMEQGSDGVAFSSIDIHEIIKVCDALQKQDYAKLELIPLTVSEVRHIGMGMRSCIDTTGLMTQEEGMLIGSTSQGGILVCSETHYLPYMNLRPFRVNAGAIHSYVWMPNNTAEYLTDLSAGSHVLCVNTQGEIRTLSVGRIKTEVRPLLLIKGEAAGKEINVIVQDDWHIRIMGADGKPKNATLIKPGDQLLSYVSEPGRHVGIKVNETILEK